MNQNKQNANDILDGYLMTQDNGNSSGLNLKNNVGGMTSAINGNSYDDNCLPEFNNHEGPKA